MADGASGSSITSDFADAPAVGQQGSDEGRPSVPLVEIAKLQDTIYQIQELRHSSTPDADGIQTLLAWLATEISRLVPLVEQDHNSSGSSREDVQDGWRKVQQRWAALKDEMNEDGWLVRFRTTAEQAEAMIDSLSKSASGLARQASGDSGMSGRDGLKKAYRGHASMRSTYVASINKILKMMDRSLTERSTKNGEALRRYGDMCSRWTALQAEMKQIEGRVMVQLEQIENQGQGADGVEVLMESLSMGGEHDYDHSTKSGKPYLGHRASDSSGSSGVGGYDPRPSLSGTRPSYPSTLSAGTTGAYRSRRPSHSSTVSAIPTNASGIHTPSRPRWNGSTKPDAQTATTPTNRRLSSYGGLTPRNGATSPSPSAASTMSNIPRMPGARARQSLPRGVSSPTPLTPGTTRTIPGLSVSTTTNRINLSHPSDIPPVPALPGRTPSRQGAARASFGTGAGAGTSANGALFSTPRHPRVSMARAPPSAYRPTTPSVPARPSSRMSVGGGSVSAVAPAELVPFEPSKYDLLDTTVADILLEQTFDLFVARCDPPLKKGQRKREDEEWKGMFVFGSANERPTSVKLVRVANRAAGGVKVTKCLARQGGQWVPLVEVLREKSDRYGEVF